MANKTLDKLQNIAASLTTLIAGANSDGVLGSLTIEALKNIIGVAANVSLSSATPATDPGDPVGNRMWVASEEGTYTHFSGITIGESEAAFIVDTGSAYTKVTIPVDLTGYYTKSEVDETFVEGPLTFVIGSQLFDKTDLIEDTYVRNDGAYQTGQAGYQSYECPIDATQGHVTFSGVVLGGVTKYIAFINAGGGVISGSVSSILTNTKTVSIPEDAVKMRFTCKNAANAPEVIDVLMVNYGETALPYEAYDKQITEINGRSIQAPVNNVYTKSEVDALIPTLELVPTGKNMADPARIFTGLVSSSANAGITTNAGWKVIIIPCAASKQYTASGWNTGRTEMAFYSGAVPAPGVSPGTTGLIQSGGAGSMGITKSAGAATFTTPASCTFVAFTLKASTENDDAYATFQLEIGSSVTSYEPFNGAQAVTKIDSNPIAADTLIVNGAPVSTADVQLKGADTPVDESGLKLTLDVNGGMTSIEGYNQGRLIRTDIVPYRVLSPDISNVLDFRSVYIDGVLVHSMVDDVAPYRLASTTIGANHGYSKTRLTIASHGKTNVDVGSVWTDGANQWVIVNIFDANNLDVSRRTGNVAYTGGTLTHVSGATHTSNITGQTATTAMQMYPAFKNRTLRVLVDDTEIIQSSKTVAAKKSVTFAESYDILDKDSIMAWLITQVGTATKILQFDGTAIVTVSISYVFTAGGCTLYTNFLALQNVPAFQDIMFNMNNQLYVSTAHPTLKFMVPHTLPFTFLGKDYDMTVPTDISGDTFTSRMQFVPERVASTGIYADRVVMLMDSVGYALGFLPVLDADIDERRANASKKALEISEAKKIYLSAIDRTDKTSLVAGDYFSVVAYKRYFVSSSQQTTNYTVESAKGDYLYCDWHSAGNKRVPVASALIGRAYTVVQKSDNVTILSGGDDVTSSLYVNISNSDPAYLILRFDK